MCICLANLLLLYVNQIFPLQFCLYVCGLCLTLAAIGHQISGTLISFIIGKSLSLQLAHQYKQDVVALLVHYYSGSTFTLKVWTEKTNRTKLIQNKTDSLNLK